jgi:hypothetical protein
VAELAAAEPVIGVDVIWGAPFDSQPLPIKKRVRPVRIASIGLQVFITAISVSALSKPSTLPKTAFDVCPL